MMETRRGKAQPLEDEGLHQHRTRQRQRVKAEFGRPEQPGNHQPEHELDQRGGKESGGHDHASPCLQPSFKGKARPENGCG
jgi:hypothetical protein